MKITIATLFIAAIMAAFLFEDEISRSLAPIRAATTLIGDPVVTDGDSLRLDGHRVRLRWVDACEIGQTATRYGRQIDCGVWARGRLVDMVGARPVTCTVLGEDRYQRALADCVSAVGEDLSLGLLRSGSAFLYDRGSAPAAHVRAAEAAEAARSGIHGFTSLATPRDYRERRERSR